MSHQSNSQSGFTIIEILVVLTIFIFIAGFALFVSMDSYRGFAFRSERDTIISVLQKARSQAISNICLGSGCSDGKPHGVRFTGSQYIIFQGPSYASRDPSVDQIIAANSTLTFSPTPPIDIIFNQLDATGAGGTFTINGSGHSSQISVNTEGRIDNP